MKPLTQTGTMTTPYLLLEEQLQALQLASMRHGYATQAAVARHQGWPYEHYLATLVEQEMDRRTRTRRQRRIQEARFPLLKELADFDFAAIAAPSQAQVRELADGAYLAQPILLVGGPGLGKTHVAIALGLAACRQHQRVRFYTVTALVNELHQDHHQLPKFLDKALRHQLIILDEFGYVPFTTSGAQLLFQFCSALHERVSLLITTNLPFAEWVQVLGSERLTAGLPGAHRARVTCTAHSLEFVGESYRFRQGLAQPASPPLPEALRNTHHVGERP